MNVKLISKLLANRPKLVLVIFTLITVLIGAQATNIYMDSNLSNYLPQDDPTINLYNEIAEKFQIGQTIIILIDQTDRINQGYNIRNPRVLEEMDEVGKAIDLQPYDNGDDDGVVSIRSLAELIKNENAKSLAEGGQGKKRIPIDQDIIYNYLERINIKSMKGTLFTNSYDVAVIIVQLSDEADFDDILERTENAVNNRGTNYADMTITGTVAYQKAVQKQSMQNLVIIFPIALVLISVVLFIFHRTIKGILIAFLPPAFSLALTFGVLGIFTPQLSLISVAIVALLLGLGVDYSIHLMNRLAEERNIQDNKIKIEKILRSTGKAVLLSTVTTIIGFASLMISSMSPMVTFGFGCAVGIFFCFISAIVLVPCLSLILKFEKPVRISSWKKLAIFTLKNRNRIIIIAVFLAIMSIVLLPQIKTDVNYLDFAPEGIEEVEAMVNYSDYFGSGSNFNALLLETEPQGLLDTDLLDAVYDMENDMREAISSVLTDLESSKIEKSVYSVVDEMKEIFNLQNKSAIIDFLSEKTGIEQVILDMIAEEGIVDKDYSKTIILVYIPIGRSIEEIEEIVNKINEIADNVVLPKNGRVSHITGQDAINVAVNKKLAEEQTRSMILALILVLAMLILIFKSTVYGLLTMVPVFFVLIWEPGFLVATEIPLSPITISIASIMVGIGIDYGVHITHRLREEIENGASKTEATKIAIERTGLSLTEAALTTIAGMSSLFLLATVALTQFVIVIILMTSLSCIGAALLLPVFYNLKIVK